MAYVAVFIPDGSMERFELRDSTVFGRSSSCNVCVNEANVSRQHCRIEKHANKWILLDLSSTNGTWLDAARVRRYALRDGETFYIGDARIVFHADKRHEHRPADPHEASRIAEIMNSTSLHDSSAETVVGVRAGRTLPSARATVVKPGWSRAVRASKGHSSLAFRRPPARPIIKDSPSSGWLGAFVCLLRPQ